MYTLLVSIEIIVSILLTIVILMQSSKGGGLAGTFGTGSMGTVFGVRRTADFLSRATTILATIFLGLCLLINIFYLPGATDSGTSIIQGGTPTTAPSPIPPVSQPAATPPGGNQAAPPGGAPPK